MVGLNPWVATIADWAGSTETPTVEDLGFGTASFALNDLLPTASRFAFSGIIGIDHLDTHYILGGVDVTPVEPGPPVPLPGAVVLMGFGLLGMAGLRRKASADSAE